MAAQVGLPRKAAGGISRTELARYVAIGAALVAAALYALIGFQVVSIGEAASGGAPDLLAFGLMVGGMFAALALILALVQRRIAWIAVGLIDLAVIVGYFAMGNLRVPPYETWGLLVKAAQTVMFVALAYLVFRGARADGKEMHT